jgi:membrane dipeptidase
MLIVDAHLDLAMNAIEWNRDLTTPIDEIRGREAGMDDKPDRTRGTVSFPEMRRGGVGLCVATQIARYVPPGGTLSGWHSPEQAWAMTQAQLAWYRAMEERGELVQLRDLDALERHVARWTGHDGDGREWSTDPIGYVLSLEGADSILTPAHLERAYAGAFERSDRLTTARGDMRRGPMRLAASAPPAASCSVKWSGWG